MGGDASASFVEVIIVIFNKSSKFLIYTLRVNDKVVQIYGRQFQGPMQVLYGNLREMQQLHVYQSFQFQMMAVEYAIWLDE